jgi:hypothetical protein
MGNNPGNEKLAAKIERRIGSANIALNRLREARGDHGTGYQDETC